jgi:hypothetical protein
VRDLLLCAKHLFVEAMVEKTATFRQRRADDTARWRERLKNGRALPVFESATMVATSSGFGAAGNVTTSAIAAPEHQAVRRVALRISRTVFSALSGMRLLACLIVAPQRATMSQQSSLTQSAHSVRQVLTAYSHRDQCDMLSPSLDRPGHGAPPCMKRGVKRASSTAGSSCPTKSSGYTKTSFNSSASKHFRSDA